MSNEAKSVRAWDLADPKSMRLLFTPDSFYIVIDGVLHQTVRHAATTIKDALARFHGIRVRGPLALPRPKRRTPSPCSWRTQSAYATFSSW